MAKNLRLTDTVVIAISGTVSASLTLDNSRIPLAIVTPSALTGTSFNFNGSIDGTSFYPIYNESTLYAVTVGTSAGRHIALSRAAFEGVRYLQVVSTSAEAAARTIKVVSGE
jgi:hypothetical protein